MIHVPTRTEGLERLQKALAAHIDPTQPDHERLAVADIAGQFIASLKGLQGAIHPSRKETAMRSVDELQSDLKAMNAAATRIALLLPAPSRGQFHALASPILESAAAVLDQAVAGSTVTRLAAEAGDLARQERREARDAREVADLAQRAAEPLRRNEGRVPANGWRRKHSPGAPKGQPRVNSAKRLPPPTSRAGSPRAAQWRKMCPPDGRCTGTPSEAGAGVAAAAGRQSFDRT